jgi:AraC family ethanolamine operon transcriptional activator
MVAQFSSHESFDISEHAEMVGKFDVRLNQISSGKFHGKVDCVKTPGMMIYEEHWRRKAEVCGVTPEGYITLGTNVAWRRSEIQWCGTAVDHRRFACGKQGSDVDFIMPDRCHDVVLLVKPDILASALSQQAFDLLTCGRTIDFTAVAGQRLINAITGTVRKYAKSSKLLENSFVVRSFESHLLETLSSCIADSNQDESLRSVPQHKAYVRNAIAQAECSDRPLTAMELAMAVDVSQRTLNYAFQNVLDMTPCSYLQMHRLNAAHRELAVADPKVSTVTNIALKWGFNHAGRFSILYRKLFDEMPSETLHRA